MSLEKLMARHMALKLLRCASLSSTKAIESELVDIALDLLGAPQDNTAETGACDVANSAGEWPEWAYSRDPLYAAWDDLGHNADRFVGFVEAWIK